MAAASSSSSAAAASSSSAASPDITAVVASIVAPFAGYRLNAALYSYAKGNDAYVLEAIFTRHRSEPRGHIKTTLFGEGLIEKEIDPKDMRTRTWLFTQREDLAVVLNKGGTYCDPNEAHAMVMWQGDTFLPPVTVKAPKNLMNKTMNRSIDEKAIYYLKRFFDYYDSPISFALPISRFDIGVDEDTVDGGGKIADAVVDKVMRFVGEVPEKKEGGGGNKRKR